jgi:hypothetical protein
MKDEEQSCANQVISRGTYNREVSRVYEITHCLMFFDACLVDEQKRLTCER